MGRLEGKVALVTGGTAGIGAATVRRFAAEGATVFFTGTNWDAAGQICCQTGAQFILHRVEDDKSWPHVIDQVTAHAGQLDIAFANAGTESGDGSIESIKLQAWDAIVAVNLTGVMLTVRHAIAAMRRNSQGAAGSIIINSSMNAYRAMANYVAYSVTKAAVVALAKSTALHCANEGTRIRCNTIHAGVVETDMIRGVINRAADPAAARAMFEGMAPMGRMAQVEEVAALVTFLASDEAAFVSGSEYGIDGAATAGMVGVA